jgi:glycosyltransferase involved in cell wall biosynthesis
MIISKGLSIVIPCFNEGNNLEITIRKILVSCQDIDFPVEVIVSDDASTDNCIERTKAAVNSALLRYILNEHAGRVETIYKGICGARYPNVMVLGSRVQIQQNTLMNLDALNKKYPDAKFWNGLVKILDNGNPLVSIWQTLVFVGWGEYLRNPTTTSFGQDCFDRFPKGSGFFITSKNLWLSGFDRLRDYASTQKIAISDDTRLIRDFAAIDDIWISPEIEAFYQPRTSWKPFIKNGFYRGTTFVDSYWDSNSVFGKLVKCLSPILTAFYFGIGFYGGLSVLLITFLLSFALVGVVYFNYSRKLWRNTKRALKETIVLLPLIISFGFGFASAYASRVVTNPSWRVRRR